MDAKSYFGKINELLLSTQATGERGAALSMDDASRIVAQKFTAVKTSGKKVLVVGNGGSAAITSHMQNDLVNALKIRSLVFTEPSLLTCLSNDFGYVAALERQAELWTEAGDMLVAVSSSGKSENILRAVKTCQAKGAYVISLTGFKPDNPLRQMGNLNFYIGIEHYGYVEATHAVLAHYLTDYTLSLMEDK